MKARRKTPNTREYEPPNKEPLMPIRIIEQEIWNDAIGPSEIECIHGESLDEPCDLCYQMANHLPIDLGEGQTLAITANKCKICDENERQPPHTCPYAAGVNNDDETKCNCCKNCEQQCSDAI